jgi:hypothetical protein
MMQAALRKIESGEIVARYQGHSTVEMLDDAPDGHEWLYGDSETDRVPRLGEIAGTPGEEM